MGARSREINGAGGAGSSPGAPDRARSLVWGFKGPGAPEQSWELSNVNDTRIVCPVYKWMERS